MASTGIVARTAVRGVRETSYAGFSTLGLAALAMVATLPGRTQGLGLITEPLIASLGMDRVSYAAVNFWATLIGASFCLPFGRLMDRFGSRAVLTGITAALGLTVIAMSQITAFALMAMAITLTRGFGQSALSVASLALVGKRFARRLNMAMGAYSLLVGIGFIIAFPAVGQAALTFGWRAAWLGVGVTITTVVAPLGWFMLRDSDPAGEQTVTGSTGTPTGSSLSDLTFAEALRSSAFWVFALASSLFGLVYSGIALFNHSILEQQGFDATVYHSALVISTLVGLGANLGGGWLASRTSLRKLMGAGMGVLAVSLAMLPFVSTFPHVAAYATAMGLSGGIVTVVFFSVWAQVFGRGHLGRIQGAAQMMTVLASAAGPLLLAETLGRTGSYRFIFFLLAAMVACLGVVSWRVRLPARIPVQESVT